MDKGKVSINILSDIITYMKYSRFDETKGRRETFEEIIDRYKKMMIKKYPKLKEEIEKNCKYLYEKKVLPSSRAMQFAGKAIEKTPIRNFNCAATSMDHPDSFKEVMFLLLSGTGVGISVQQHHIERLPEIFKPKKKRRYLIGDNCEAWAEAIGALIDAYMGNRKSLPVFDFCDIRAKGLPLKISGGKSPGSNDLKVCMVQVQNILDSKKDGDRLTSVEITDMICYIATCIVSGGIRRSSVLALFSFDDAKMKEYKANDWFIQYPHRAMVNISASILRHKIKEDEFFDYFEYMKNGNGEPAIFWTNNQDLQTNPCVAKSTLVNTPHGLKKVETIKEGDKVITVKGIEKVNSIKKYKKRPVFKVITSNLTENRVTKDHIFYVKKNNKVEERRTEELLVGDKLVTTPCALYGNELPEINYKLRLLEGVLLGDGCYTRKSLSHNKELKICTNQQSTKYNANIKRLLQELSYKVYKDNLNKNGTSMNIITGPAAMILSDTNLDMLYSHEKSINIEGIQNRREALAILHGLLVTDGNINNKTQIPEIRFDTSSHKMASGIVQLLLFCGYKSSITIAYGKKGGTIDGRKIKRNHPMHTVHLCGRSAKEFAVEIVGNLIHPEKKKRMKEFIRKIVGSENHWTTKVTNIVADGYSDVYDIYCKDSDTWVTSGLVQKGCGEASLKSGQFCNLTTINTANIETQKEFNKRAEVASFFGTLQAGFTDFHLLREHWKERTEEDSLIGVSLSGVAAGNILDLDVKEAANGVVEENDRVSKLIGINKAARTTLLKPEGTSSLLLGCSSGIHAYHSEYYIRRVRVLKTEPIYHYLKMNHLELLEDDVMRPTVQSVISIPIKAPDGSITRKETALQLLGRVKRLYKDWVLPGHRSGQNTHSISCTVTVKPHEWEKVGSWLWENRDFYASITTFPYDDDVYPQMPFESIPEQKYNELLTHLKKIDLSKIKETEDNTNLSGEIACGGGACEIT